MITMISVMCMLFFCCIFLWCVSETSQMCALSTHHMHASCWCFLLVLVGNLHQQWRWTTDNMPVNLKRKREKEEEEEEEGGWVQLQTHIVHLLEFGGGGAVGFVIRTRVDIKHWKPCKLHSHVTVEYWCLCFVGGFRIVCLDCSWQRISIKQQCQLPYIVLIILEKRTILQGAANHLQKRESERAREGGRQAASSWTVEMEQELDALSHHMLMAAINSQLPGILEYLDKRRCTLQLTQTSFMHFHKFRQ